MEFGRRRRSGGGNGSNEFPNLTQFDEVRTTPISAANADGQPMFGEIPATGAQNAPSFGAASYGQANDQPSFGGVYDQQNQNPSFGGDSYNRNAGFGGTPYAPQQPAVPQQPAFGSMGQSGYFVAPIPQNNERPMVFSDSRVKGQYIYEYSDRLEYYMVSGKSIVHCATRYKIRN